MPWVSQDILTELLAAQRELRALASREASAPVAPVPAPAVKPPAPVVDVEQWPRAVLEACDRFAFDDPVERAANFRLAQELITAGRPASEVVERIKQGGRVAKVAW